RGGARRLGAARGRKALDFARTRDRGGTGRRASLRSWWGNPWGFESLRSHYARRLDVETSSTPTPHSPYRLDFSPHARDPCKEDACGARRSVARSDDSTR